MIRKPEDCRDMDELRKEIDRIDDRLVTLLAERAAYIKRAVEMKRVLKLPAFIPERVEAIITNVKTKSLKQNLDPDLAETVWRTMIDWFVKFEKEKLSK